MKRNIVRGMRDIPTLQGLRSVSLPNTMPQAATELARLEHEKARLERELNMWLNNQKRTEERLRRVEKRLALVQQVLVPPADDGTPTRPVHQPSTRKEGSGEKKSQNWNEISLEY